MSTASAHTRRMVQLSLMAAIVVLLSFVPFLGYIPLVVIKATTVHIPVILGAILLGPKAGGILGGVFGITSVINIFQPEILCIGGGISREGEALLAPVRAYVDKEEYTREGDRRTKIVAAKLNNDAGVLGAATLGMQNQ